jgi:putative oxidoreductase
MASTPLGSFLLLLARVLMSAIFLSSGAMKVADWSGTASHMAEEGMVAVPVLLAGAIAVELGAGAGVLVGCGTRWSALALAAFLVPTTLIFHDFWTFDGPARQGQMQHFMKNLTIIGGLLALAVAGAGRYSIDA